MLSSKQRVDNPKLPGEGLSYNAALSKMPEEGRVMLDQVARFCISLRNGQREMREDLKRQQENLNLILQQLRDHDGLMKVKTIST